MTRPIAAFLFLPIALGSCGCALTRIGKDYKKDYNFTVSGAVIADDDTPLQDVDVALEVNGPVYEAIDLVREKHVLTDKMGSFVFAYLSHERGLEYTITVSKAGFETQVLRGAAPPAGKYMIRLMKSAKDVTQSQ